MSSFRKLWVQLIKIPPLREKQVKQNSQVWFDKNIADEIKNHGKLFKMFKKSKLHISKDTDNVARYEVKKMI